MVTPRRFWLPWRENGWGILEFFLTSSFSHNIVVLKEKVREGFTVGLHLTNKEGTMMRKSIIIFMMLVGVSLLVLACAANQVYAKNIPEISAEGLKIVELHVIGCTWETTGERVRSILLGVDGVVNVVINYSQQTATVTFDPAKTTVEDMIFAVENDGSGEFHVSGSRFLN